MNEQIETQGTRRIGPHREPNRLLSDRRDKRRDTNLREPQIVTSQLRLGWLSLVCVCRRKWLWTKYHLAWRRDLERSPRRFSSVARKCEKSPNSTVEWHKIARVTRRHPGETLEPPVCESITSWLSYLLHWML